VVREDNIAITVNRDGFFKRTLPTGRHILHPFERIEFTLETRTKLTANRASAVATSDGILININWSSTYTLQPDLITQHLSQRLRSLPNAERSITRHADICLRKLVGDYTMQDLFKPATRERIEQQLNHLLAERLNPTGIGLKNLYLQAVEIPEEVAEALNKARAIETLDGAIRQLDPATREIVRGAYQLDEILHWNTYLPSPARLTMKRLETVAH
jgi:regulator of protease activity HflC (stomatin/prohibitin superfamily)